MARKGLPKSIIKKYGISKKAWRVYRGQKSSKKSSKRKVKKTAKRRKYSRKKKTRRKRSNKIPISVIAAGLHLWTGEPNPGWASVQTYITNPNYRPYVGHAIIAALTGIRLQHLGQQTTEIDVMGILNPFDMRNAPTTKVYLWTHLITKLIKKIAGNPISKVPYLRDFVTFS